MQWRDIARKFHYRVYGYIYMISLFTYFWHAACWLVFYTTERRNFVDLLNKVLRIDWLFYFMLRTDWCRWLSINNDYCLLMTLLLSTTIDGNHSNVSNQTSHNVCKSLCKMPFIFVQLHTSIFSTDFSKMPNLKISQKSVLWEEAVLCWQTHLRQTWRSQQSLFSTSQMHLKSSATSNTYPITTYNFNYGRHNNTRTNGNVRIIISDYAVQLAFRQESASDIRKIKTQNHRQYICKTCAALHCCF